MTITKQRKPWLICLAVVLMATLPSSHSYGAETQAVAIEKSPLVQKLEAIFYDADFAKIPDGVFPAADYGVKADGETVHTKGIQAAIDAAHAAGGGVVTLPQGTTVSGALFLKSNVELRLDEGVVLQAVAEDAAFPDKWTRVAGIEMDWPAALINVYEQENVRITGEGVIDGNGPYWWGKFREKKRAYRKHAMRWAVDYDAKRVRPIVVYKSKEVKLKDFTVQRAGFWTITFTYSDRVYADGITIRNNIGGHGPSTDGINTDSSTNVLIENCDIDCNDDNFSLKAGRDSDGLRVNLPTENVVIRNCKIGRGWGIVALGSETSGGIHNVEVYGIRAKGTRNGIFIKSSTTRGGIISNIYFHDLEMDGVRAAFAFNLNWFPRYSYPPRPKHIPESEWPAHWKVLQTKVTPPERGTPVFRDLKISDVTVTNSGQAFSVNGLPQSPLKDFQLKNVSFDVKSAGSISHAENWKMENVTIKTETHGNTVKMTNTVNVESPDYIFPKLDARNARGFIWPAATLLAGNEQMVSTVGRSSGHDLKDSRDQGQTFTIVRDGTMDRIAMSFEDFQPTGTADFTLKLFEVKSATDPTPVGEVLDSVEVSAADIAEHGYEKGAKGTLIFDVEDIPVKVGDTYAIEFDTERDPGYILKWRLDNSGNYTGGQSFGNRTAASDFHFGVYDKL